MTVLPFTSLKIYAFDIPIVEMSKEEADEKAAWGQFVKARMLIRIQTDGLTVRQMAETALHEILHAVWEFSALKVGDEEERTVTAIAQGVSMVFRDNPAFAEWWHFAMVRGREVQVQQAGVILK